MNTFKELIFNNGHLLLLYGGNQQLDLVSGFDAFKNLHSSTLLIENRADGV